MNELTVRRDNLPAYPTETVKMYVDVIGDAIADLKAKRDAAMHMGVDGATVAEMQRQINEYSALQRQAEMELGKRTMKMEKPTVGNPQFFQGSEKLDAKSKAEQLAEIGIAPQRANEYETMAKNEDVVNRYIEESLAEGKAPSKSGAIAAIKEEKSYITPDSTDTPSDYANSRKLFAEIRKTSASMASGESTKYTQSDLISELRVLRDEFIGKVNQTLKIRKSVIGDGEKVLEILASCEKKIIEIEERIKRKQ